MKKNRLKIVKHDETCPICHRQKWFIKKLHKECTKCGHRIIKQIKQMSDYFD